MSAATLPPWLSPWSSGLVYGQRVWQVAKPERYRPRPRLTIYTLGHGNNAPILRFSSWSEEGSGVGSPGRGGEGVDGSAPPPPAVRWERVPLDHEPWHVDVPVPVQPRIRERPPPFDHDVEYGGDSSGSEEALHAWSGVVRGWAAGATLLALLVVMVRVGEKLLDFKIMLRRRRLHREWQRANVRATSRNRRAETPPLANLGAECTVEMPPPYSACSPAGAGAGAGAAAPPGAVSLPKDEHEEPPPPYSDVVTQFFDKNGQPVLLYSRDPPRDPTAPPSAYESDDSQRAIARLLRVYGVDGTNLPPPDDDARLFQHVYQAFSGIADGNIENGEDEAIGVSDGTESDVEANQDDTNDDANTNNDAGPTDAVVEPNNDDPKDGSVVV